MVANDPVVRYTAGAILVLAFLGCMAIAVHGYWTNANYTLPPIIDTILTAGVAGALTLLGVHVGNSASAFAAGSGANPPPKPPSS
jgi:hypothetical protein